MIKCQCFRLVAQFWFNQFKVSTTWELSSTSLSTSLSKFYLYLYLHLDWRFNQDRFTSTQAWKVNCFCLWTYCCSWFLNSSGLKITLHTSSVRMPPTQIGMVLLWVEMLLLRVKMSKLQLGRLLSLNPSIVSQTECQTASLLQLKIHVSLEFKATSPSMSLFPRGIADCKTTGVTVVTQVKHTQRHSKEAVFPQRVLESFCYSSSDGMNECFESLKKKTVYPWIQ